MQAIKRLGKRLMDKAFYSYWQDPAFSRDRIGVDKAAQTLLFLRYRELLHDGKPLPALEDVGFRAFSQTDEDGILLYIFALIGTTNRLCAEICAGDGTECNTANLIINHGWRGLLFDGDENNVQSGRRFYAAHRDTLVVPPKFVHAWISRDNINQLLEDGGFKGEIDLLSLDIDGIDYWLWKSIESITPRVMVVEYNQMREPVTVPYRSDFRASNVHPNYMGASLPAFVNLGRERGYRLVGCNRFNFNAFFVRDDLGKDVLPEVSAESCWARCHNPADVQAAIAELGKYEWVAV